MRPLPYGPPRHFDGQADRFETDNVSMERVIGSLGDKRGTFALQGLGSMDAKGPRMIVQVVAGSGTGDFPGITGTFTITIHQGEHNYDFAYQFP